MPIPFKMIDLDKPRKLRFTTGAMIEFEDLTKIKLTELDTNISITTLIKLLWVMLKQEEPNLTQKQVQNLVDEYTDDVKPVMESAIEAVQMSFGVRKNPKKPTVVKQS